MPARALNPSSSPGPRNDVADVRVGLSFEALKRKGVPVRRAVRTSRPAKSAACSSLSITQGPAISANGLPPPIERSPSLSGVTGPLYEGGRGGKGRGGGSRVGNAAFLSCLSQPETRPARTRTVLALGS